MTSGYGDKEREFLDALEADTGRSLAQWMEAIRAEGLAERNDIIDWLRRQGFRFSRASWLERVHHNGGKPIYADRPAGERPVAVKRARPVQRAAAPGPAAPSQSPGVLGSALPANLSFARQPAPASSPTGKPAADAYAAAAAANIAPMATFSDPLSPEITAVTAKAKAYRPLADFLLREIAKTVPGATFAVRGAVIHVAAGREFATLAISARDLKLAVTQGGSITLTDARQVDDALLTRLKAAAATAS